MNAVLRATTHERRDLAEVGDDVFGDAVAEVFLLGIAAHVGERQDADRRAVGVRASASGAARSPRAAVASHGEDAHRTLDILHRVLAQILERRTRTLPATWSRTVRETAMPPDWRERLQPRGDVDAVAIDVVAFDDDVAEIDADAVADALVLRRARLRRVPIASWIASAQLTAATTLANSTSAPSPMSLTTRPPWPRSAAEELAAIALSRSSVPASSRSIRPL